MLPIGYRPLPEWVGSTETWQHAVVDDSSPRPILAPLPLDLSVAGYPRWSVANSIVYTDREAWSEVPKSGSAKACRTRHRIGRVGTQVVGGTLPCGTWHCEACAIKLVLTHLRWLHEKLSGQGRVRLIWTPMSLTAAQQRALGRTRAMDEPNNTAWYVQLPLTEGRGVLLAVFGVPGGALGEASARWVSPLEAFAAFRSELRLPDRLNLTGSNFGPSYRRGGEPPKPSSRYVSYAAGLTGNQVDAFWMVANRLSKERFGVASFHSLDSTRMDSVAKDAADFAKRQPR